MLSLVGGELYQWDTGRIVRVVPDENVKVHEVHFSTKRMDYAYVLKTYTEDGVTYCAIPNIILQQSNRLLCYEVCENSDGEETISNAYFDIIKRNRPEDYVYTEQEHFTFAKLEKRIDALSNSLGGYQPKGDYLTQDDLQDATDAVLAQAKESGEFDGADGYSPTVNVTQNDNGSTITITDKNGTTTATVTNGTGGASAWSEITDKPFNTIDGNTLINRSGALCVNTTDDAEQDNTRPITSSGVHVICGNINALLQAI